MRRRKLIMHTNRQTLAVDGGAPTFPGGPPPWPLADDDVREQLLTAYNDGAWGSYHARYVACLEEQIAEYNGVAHALTCSSGTIAVEVALRALNVGPDDEVILAGYDFAGNFRAIEAIGARPVLVDLLPDSWAIDPQQANDAISSRTKAIVASHLHASIAPMEALVDIAAKRGIHVVEDACQAQGAVVAGKPAGTWGDVGVWSFGGSKLLTSGRGGAIYTDDDQIHQRAKTYCERGNHAFALSELQAAVLLPQLEKLKQRNETRHESATQLYQETANAGVLIPPGRTPNGCRPSYYKMSWLLDMDVMGERTRAQFIAAARAEGIALDVGFRGFTKRPASRCCKPFALPEAERAVASTVLLHHPVLLESKPDIALVADALLKVDAAVSAAD